MTGPAIGVDRAYGQGLRRGRQGLWTRLDKAYDRAYDRIFYRSAYDGDRGWTGPFCRPVRALAHTLYGLVQGCVGLA